jgi:hypothetical protein
MILLQGFNWSRTIRKKGNGNVRKDIDVLSAPAVLGQLDDVNIF